MPGHAQDTAVSGAETAEQIEMLFGLCTRVGRMKRRRCGLLSNYFDHLFFLSFVIDRTNKSSVVAEMGDRLATIDMAEK